MTLRGASDRLPMPVCLQLCASPGVSTKYKILSILLWGSGFEVTQRYLFFPVNFTHNEIFGADLIPARGNALSPDLDDDHAAMLDKISEVIVNRQQTLLNPAGKETSHMEQMTAIYAGKMAVVGAALGDVVPEELWPLVWRYDHTGGDLTAFFTRMAEHSAMDDFTEMHLASAHAIPATS